MACPIHIRAGKGASCVVDTSSGVEFHFIIIIFIYNMTLTMQYFHAKRVSNFHVFLHVTVCMKGRFNMCNRGKVVS